MKVPTKLDMSFLSCVLVASTSIAGAPDACDIMPFDSVNNGMGAEMGAVREFASGISIPGGCRQNGRTWIPLVGVNLTRTAQGAPDLDFDVFIRSPDGIGGPPSSFHTDPNHVTASGIPLFPSSQYVEFNASANNNQNVNNVLWGDYQYIDAAIDGDLFPGVFITADQTGTPGETPCFTAINGAVPLDPCTNGNPNLNAAGLGAGSYTYYGRYTSGSQIMGREHLPSTWSARYLNSDLQREATLNLAITEGSGGPIICQYSSIPTDFSFVCGMTAGQLALLAAGGVYAEEEVDGITSTTLVIPAEIFIYADGFESAGTTVWSASTP